MDTDIDFTAISVPITWTGRQRELEDGRKVWACGGCEHPEACAAEGECDRALPSDYRRTFY